jgi:HEAT repeat protein
LDATRAMQMIGKPAVKSLIAALKSRDLQVRKAAAIALGEIGDPSAVEPMIAMMREGVKLGHLLDSGAQYRRHEAEEMSKALEILSKSGRSSIEPLLSTVEGKAINVRKEAVRKLGSFKDQLALDPLLKDLYDEDVVKEAILALGKIGDPRAVEPLSNMLKAKDVDIRYSAASALGNIGDPRALDYLEPLLLDDYSSVREAAKGSIYKLQGRIDG